MKITNPTSLDAFLPIQLLPPDTAALSQLRERVEDSTAEIDIALRFSTKPERIWSMMFLRLWSLFFPDMKPPMIGVNALIVYSSPAKLQSQLEIARVVVEWTNSLSAPLIRGEAAQIAADTKRSRALDEFHMQMFPLPNVGKQGIAGDESSQMAVMDARMVMARREQDMREKKLRKHLAQEEIDTAISMLASSN
jgi:hypothetical protein